MSYPKQLAKLRPVGGLVRDLPAWEVGPNHYTVADNVVFRQGFAERRPGERFAYEPPGISPIELLNYVKEGVVYWVYVGVAAQWVVTGATHTDITRAGPIQNAVFPELHSLLDFNGTVVHSTTVDDPSYWDGNPANKFLALPDWPAGTRCVKMVAFKFHLFALSLEETVGARPNKILWSNAAEPGTVPNSWTPGPDNEAGDVELADSGGIVMTAAVLRDSLLIYKRNAIYQANYVGGNQVFEFRPLFRNLGAMSPRAVAVTNNGHVFLADNDVLFTDGVSVRSIAHARVRRAIFEQQDFAVFQRTFLVYYRPKNEVWICFPADGTAYAGRAFIYNLDTDAWSERPLPNIAGAATGIIVDESVDESWDSDAGAWDADTSVWSASPYSVSERLLMAVPGPPAHFVMADSEDPELIDAVIGKHDLTFDAPERLKYVTRLHLRAEHSGAEFFVKVGAKMNPSDAITWQPEVAVTTDQVINVSVTGRYISYEVRSENTALWKVTGLDMEVELRGYH